MIYLIKTVIAIKNASFFYIYSIYIYQNDECSTGIYKPPKILSTNSFVGTATLFIYA